MALQNGSRQWRRWQRSRCLGEALASEKQSARAGCSAFSMLSAAMLWLLLLLSADRLQASTDTTLALPTPSALAQVSRRVSVQGEEIRVEFARVVLTELFISYLQASVDAKDELMASNDRSLQRWITAVDRYAAYLQALAEQPRINVQVISQLGDHSDLVLLIDGEAVMVSSIRLARQAELERAIVAQFCRRQRCSGALEPPVSRASGWRQMVAPVWHLGADGPSCRGSGGLVLKFVDMSGMQAKRQACRQVFSELETLASELAHQRRLGIVVNWDQLRVLPSLGDRGSAVRLNASGDTLWLHVPALARSRQLFPRVSPWLAARASGVDIPLVLADAERIFAALLH